MFLLISPSFLHFFPLSMVKNYHFIRNLTTIERPLILVNNWLPKVTTWEAFAYKNHIVLKLLDGLMKRKSFLRITICEFLRGGWTEMATKQENFSSFKFPARVAISPLRQIVGMYVSLSRKVENTGWRHIQTHIINHFRLINISNVYLSPATW